MASRVAILILLNIVFFTVTNACGTCQQRPKINPSPKKNPPSHTKGKCPLDTLKLGVCVKVLNLVDVVIGKPPKSPCCSLIENLVDLEAAVCLCTALKADLLGINLNVPLKLTALVNYCGKKVPAGFQCA